ncbi:hypothetical protein JNO42_08370 [Pseudomonas putida]|uniref:hypothetical protein n=1 Tax=Pseudomonas putida TaxID=303 RepID=UPI00035D81FD|nr:hypothetical protein [Pseudomonas putida]ULL07017.1 hypothetical protein JNO42_08370 [Pseudomonas putida]
MLMHLALIFRCGNSDFLAGAFGSQRTIFNIIKAEAGADFVHSLFKGMLRFSGEIDSR